MENGKYIQVYVKKHRYRIFTKCDICGEKIGHWVEEGWDQTPCDTTCSQCQNPIGYNPRAGISLIKRPVNNHWVDNENDNLCKIYER